MKALTVLSFGGFGLPFHGAEGGALQRFAPARLLLAALRPARGMKWLLLAACGCLAVADQAGQTVAAAEPSTSRTADEIPWHLLENPILGREDWAIKDHCLIERDGWFYLFASAFYPEDGDIRSHIVSFKTRDFLIWSEPLLAFYGREMGLNGFTSPSIHQFGERYILVFGRWSTPRLTSRNPPPQGSKQ